MKKRIPALLAVAALITAGVLVPSATASADDTTTVTIKLVKPSGTAIGTAVDSTGSINVDAYDSDGDEDSDYYYAPADDPTDYPGGTRIGPLVNGQGTFTVPVGDEIYVNTTGGDDYLETFNQYAVHSTALVKSIKATKGASIAGTVTTPSNTALEDAAVTAVDSEGGIDGFTTTDSSGHYTLQGLTTGKYKLQFNSRSTSASQSAQDDYTYNYYNNKRTWSGGSYVSVKQQGKSSSASVKTGYNDKVLVGHTLTVNVDLGTSPGEYDYANIGIDDGKYAQSIYFNLNSTGTQAVTKLARGTYVISIYNDEHYYFWTGNTSKPTKSYSKAKKLDFKDTGNVTIQFG